MRVIAATGLGLFVLAGSLHPQDVPPKKDLPPVPETRRQCDVTRTEIYPYCASCALYPNPDQIEKNVHLKCGTKIVNQPTCVKTAIPCKFHSDDWVLHARRCCPINVKDCCNEITVLAKIEYKCDKCLRRGFAQDQVIHVNTDCPGKVVKTCAKSGFFPHGGEPVPVFGAGPIERSSSGVPSKDEPKP